ncbi:MAG: imidazole glycerol phosphate synthase subunit HisH [Planctomycetota bacterium]
MIGIVNLGLANVGSVQRALGRLGAEGSLRATPDFRDCTHLILPGVGHFGRAADLLTSAWRTALKDWIAAGRPLLGICLGYQLLFEGSSEAPEAKGLAILRGACQRVTSRLVPHMGWNRLKTEEPSGASFDGAFMYFTHSFAPPAAGATWSCEDGAAPFGVGTVKGKVVGVQFHPEKSATDGSRLLKAFLEDWR